MGLCERDSERIGLIINLILAFAPSVLRFDINIYESKLSLCLHGPTRCKKFQIKSGGSGGGGGGAR